MKKNLLLFLSLIVILWSCSTSSEDEPNPNNNNNNNNNSDTEVVKGCTDPNANNYNSEATEDDGSCTYDMTSNVSSTLPSSFTTKILLEELTGTWCGWCVDGALRLNDLIDSNGGQVIGAAIHEGDAMELSYLINFFRSTYGSLGFPTGLVNRATSVASEDVVMSRGEWTANVNALKTKTVNMGLAIDAEIDDNSLTVLTHIGNNAETSDDYLLDIYILEDGLVYSQRNYYNGYSGAESHPYYSQPDPISDYVHDHVVVGSLTPTSGYAIPSYIQTAGNVYQKLYTVDISNFNKENLSIVAFVRKDGGAIVNVQELKLNGTDTSFTKDFD